MENRLEEIIAWLEAGDAADYQAGVTLLEKHSKTRSLLNQLRRKESANNFEKLRYELVKVGCDGRLEDVSEVLNHFAQAVAGAVALVEVPEPEQPAPARDQVPEASRCAVDELTQLMQRLHNQRVQLSNSLAGLPEGDGPRVVAEILALQNQYNALAEKRRRLATGQEAAPESPADDTMPVDGPPVAAAPADRAGLLQRRNNLRANLSKAKGAATKNPDDQAKAEKVAKLAVELDVLELQIKQLPA